VDPVSLAASVLTIFATLSAPIANALKKKWLARKVRKTIASVTRVFVASYPQAAAAVFSSPGAIAEELSRLSVGVPVVPRVLSQAWVDGGFLNVDTADRLAREYIARLNAALIAIDGFRDLMVAQTAIATTTILDAMEDRQRREEERRIALGYFAAADRYYRSARELLDGDLFAAEGTRIEAENLLEQNDLIVDWRIKEKFKDLRDVFRYFVRDHYEDLVDAVEDGVSPLTLYDLLEALRLGSEEFKQRVRDSSL
jgi:hypothetical protein